jgi:hypothetical protein
VVGLSQSRSGQCGEVKILDLTRTLNSDPSVVQFAASRCTDYDTATLILIIAFKGRKPYCLTLVDVTILIQLRKRCNAKTEINSRGTEKLKTLPVDVFSDFQKHYGSKHCSLTILLVDGIMREVIKTTIGNFLIIVIMV